jgi:hypothetical protein
MLMIMLPGVLMLKLPGSLPANISSTVGRRMPCPYDLAAADARAAAAACASN